MNPSDRLNDKLIRMARNGDVEGVIEALEEGADVDAYNDQAMRAAEYNKHVKVMRVLEQHRCKLTGEYINIIDHYSVRRRDK